jgi:mono/diheme cytochrome c family protein
MCHGKALEGTWEVPPLTGRFVANWSKASPRDLHAYLRRAMPLFAPGSLSEQDATNLVAYLMRSNGLIVRPAPGKSADPRLDGTIVPGAARSR